MPKIVCPASGSREAELLACGSACASQPTFDRLSFEEADANI